MGFELKQSASLVVMDNIDNKKPKHKRRKRYKGTHPKTYAEKYKELEPEKYKETIEKIIQKGSTPAGMHRPIMVDEIMDFLEIKPGQVGLDATLGYGGHTQEILSRLDFKGHLYALDVDSVELPKTHKRLENLGYGSEILTTCLVNFSKIDQVVEKSGPLNFMMADLGVSSMQIDNPQRGFSYKNDGPLDLRLNPEKGLSAAQRLRDLSQDELAGLFIQNSDEPHAEIIAKAIFNARRSGMKITTTTELRDIITDALKFLPKETQESSIKKSCQRCFQALRIDVNGEFEALYEFLAKLPDALAPGGRVAILSFHSGEDRMVKKAFQRYFREGIFSEIAKSLERPSGEETASNSRARSAKLRWAIKTE